jgi:hypothetical protein
MPYIFEARRMKKPSVKLLPSDDMVFLSEKG